ncbi:MAG: hypothetical protein AAF483_29145, partial [Planctomycetota bacterium]
SKEAIVKEAGAVIDIAANAAIAWNTGGGLIAALSSNCQQTSHSKAFVQWLRNSRSRESIGPIVQGVDGLESDAKRVLWFANNSNKDAMQSRELPAEPRLPFARDYRAVLATELIAFLEEKKDATEALDTVYKQWQEISEKAGATQLRAYEGSLGLGF